jgi:hypothetical protein
MRTAIVAHLDAGGAGLNPPVRAAVEKLREVQNEESTNAQQSS